MSFFLPFFSKHAKYSHNLAFLSLLLQNGYVYATLRARAFRLRLCNGTLKTSPVEKKKEEEVIAGSPKKLLFQKKVVWVPC